MEQLRFLGTGEACDPERGNTSLLLTVADGSLLFDCGFTVPHRFFALEDDADRLAGVWLSHGHGDHCFGLPLLLLRLGEMGRRRPLAIAGPQGVGPRVKDLLDVAYPGFASRLGFEVAVQEAADGDSFVFAGLPARTAATEHGLANLAVRVSVAGRELFYSGDGRPTRQSLLLADGCDLVVHEAFTVRGGVEGHGAAVPLAQRLASRVGRLALVHVGRGFRAQMNEWLAGMGPKTTITVPEDGLTVAL